MGSKPSKTNWQPTPVATETATVLVVSKTPRCPRIPNEIIDEVLNHLVAGSASWDDSLQRSLQSCSLVSKSWVPSCRRYLFHTIIFTSRDVNKWLKTFPMPEKSPAHYVKDLRFSLGGRCGAPDNFSKHTPWFTNVEKMALTMNRISLPPRTPFPARLPRSVTSLAIKGAWEEIDLVQMRDIMARLPNLNDLILSGTVVAQPESRKPLPGLGTGLRGRFGGELRIRNGHIDKEFVDMLLEVPTGLHFTKIYIYADCPCLLQTVRLAEACCETLVNFSYSGFVLSKSHPFRSPSFTGSNVGTLTFSPDHRWSRAFRAVLRLFQVPKSPNSDLRPPVAPWTSPIYLHDPLDPQTLHLPTPIPCPSQSHWSHVP